MKKADIFLIGVISAVFACAVCLVGRLPAVPLDDSWNFALPLRHFLKTGVPAFDSFNSAAAVLHLLFSAPFVLIFGFGFPQTVAFNLLITWLCMLAVYFLGKYSGASGRTSVFASLVYFAAPPTFVTAFTFQSDPVFILFELLSLIGFVLYFKTRKSKALIFASAIAALSIWGKMHGVLIAPAIIAAMLFQKDFRQKTPTQHWVILGLPTLASLILFKLSKPLIHPVSATLDRKFGEFTQRLFSPETWLREGTFRVDMACMILTFYLLPLILASYDYLPSRDKGRKTPWFMYFLPIAAAILTWIICLRAIFHFKPWPMISSVLTEPPAMPQIGLFYYLYIGTLVALPLWILWSLKLKADKLPGHQKTVFISAVLVFVSQLALLVPIKLFMDRYFLALMPPVILMSLMLPAVARRRIIVFACLIAAFLATDIARVKQYRNGCEAQWRAADALVGEGIASTQIDGGYAWVGWNNFEKCQALPKPDKDANVAPWVRELCPHMRPSWKVTFHPPAPEDEFKIKKQLRYDLGWLRGHGMVYVLEKVNPPKD